MKRTLRRAFFIIVALCIPAGFFTAHEHPVFFWHQIPLTDVGFGFLGALLLIMASRLLASLVQRREDFYD